MMMILKICIPCVGYKWDPEVAHSNCLFILVTLLKMNKCRAVFLVSPITVADNFLYCPTPFSRPS